MSFQDDVQVLAGEGTVGVVWLIGDDLKCYYQYGDWAVDPTIPFNAWKNQTPSIDFGGGLKFTVIAITPENLNKYKKLLVKNNWKKIDFTKFSKVHNKSLEKYDFSIDILLDQLR